MRKARSATRFYVKTHMRMVDVAQLGRALRCGRSGCRFKSGRPPNLYLVAYYKSRIVKDMRFTISDLLLAINQNSPCSSTDRTRDS